MRKVGAWLCLVAMVLAPSAARAWGYTGHRIINAVAVKELPDDFPAFVRTPEAAATIEALGPEMDRLKGSGFSWDHDDDPGHYVDVGDDHHIVGKISLNALPPDMEAYEKALSADLTDPYKIGYLPYSIADGWEQLREDFAYWRAFDYLAMHGGPYKATWVTERGLRESLIVRDIGVWGHFVGDGSQPLHVTVHFNDHGLHARFEGEFVRQHVTEEAVAREVPPGGPRSDDHLLDQREILAAVGEYLLATNAEEPQVYAIDRRGGFRKATPEAIAFTTARVADGARELRDLILQAYDNSQYASVGYPSMSVQDILNGKVAPLPTAFGGD